MSTTLHYHINNHSKHEFVTCILPYWKFPHFLICSLFPFVLLKCNVNRLSYVKSLTFPYPFISSTQRKSSKDTMTDVRKLKVYISLLIVCRCVVPFETIKHSTDGQTDVARCSRASRGKSCGSNVTLFRAWCDQWESCCRSLMKCFKTTWRVHSTTWWRGAPSVERTISHTPRVGPWAFQLSPLLILCTRENRGDFLFMQTPFVVWFLTLPACVAYISWLTDFKLTCVHTVGHQATSLYILYV